MLSYYAKPAWNIEPPAIIEHAAKMQQFLPKICQDSHQYYWTMVTKPGKKSIPTILKSVLLLDDLHFVKSIHNEGVKFVWIYTMYKIVFGELHYNNNEATQANNRVF